MKTFKKIDLYFAGEYLCSTNQSKTCKDAVAKYLERIKTRIFYNGLVDQRILKSPKFLKAEFSK